MDTFNDLSDQERFVSRMLAREDLYYFSRYMFLARRNFPWLRSDHQVICDALMRVYRGERKRLIINVPPLGRSGRHGRFRAGDTPHKSLRSSATRRRHQTMLPGPPWRSCWMTSMPWRQRGAELQQ